MAVGAQAVAAIFDQDELIRQERERLTRPAGRMQRNACARPRSTSRSNERRSLATRPKSTNWLAGLQADVADRKAAGDAASRTRQGGQARPRPLARPAGAERHRRNNRGCCSPLDSLVLPQHFWVYHVFRPLPGQVHGHLPRRSRTQVFQGLARDKGRVRRDDHGRGRSTAPATGLVAPDLARRGRRRPACRRPVRRPVPVGR